MQLPDRSQVQTDNALSVYTYVFSRLKRVLTNALKSVLSLINFINSITFLYCDAGHMVRLQLDHWYALEHTK